MDKREDLRNNAEENMRIKEGEIKYLREELAKSVKKGELLEGNVSRLMDDNTVLKNSMKVEGQEKTTVETTKINEMVETINLLSIAMKKIESYTTENFKKVNQELDDHRKALSQQPRLSSSTKPCLCTKAI